MKVEVPEINQEMIDIMGAARDPGSRAKVAVRELICPILIRWGLVLDAGCVSSNGHHGVLATVSGLILCCGMTHRNLCDECNGTALQKSCRLWSMKRKRWILGSTKINYPKLLARVADGTLASELTGWTLMLLASKKLKQKQRLRQK